MSDCSEYLEELFLFANRSDTQKIAGELQSEFIKREIGVSNQAVDVKPLAEDEMGVKNHWQQQFGESIDPVDHVLSLIEYRFTLPTEQAPDLDALSMKMYGVVRDVIKNFDAVEYFSMFSEDTETGSNISKD